MPPSLTANKTVLHPSDGARVSAVGPTIRELRCDDHGEIHSVSPTHSEIVGHSVFSLTNPAGGDVIRAVVREHRRSGVPVRFRLSLTGPIPGWFDGVAERMGVRSLWLVRRIVDV